MDWEEFYSRGINFLENLSSQLRGKIQFPDHWWIDHICYRTETYERYQELKQKLSGVAELLIESEVGGRPIATFRLLEPFYFGSNAIYLLELPAPKAGKYTPEGFEHVEIVCDWSFEKIIEFHSGLKFNKKGLCKEFNPELELELDGISIKFHHLSLESVIRLEKNNKVFNAISQLGILKELRAFKPEVIGTFPLGIQTQKSDVDIALETSDLDKLEVKLKDLFDRYPDFAINRNVGGKFETIIVKFWFQDIRFEIFAQSQSVMQQDGFIHFQVEERILKMGTTDFRTEVIGKKKSGEKTEPAFAKILALVGDPYQALKNIHHLSNSDLQLLMGNWSKKN